MLMGLIDSLGLQVREEEAEYIVSEERVEQEQE
jgi:hypothetical protein